MKITFDSNTFRKVIDPTLIRNNEAQKTYKVIFDAIITGKVLPYFSSAMFILEEPPKKERPEHLAKRKTEMVNTWRSQKNGHIRGQFKFGPDHSTATQLSSYSIERFERAIALGFNMIHVPRLGMPMPQLVRDNLSQSTDESEANFHIKNELKGKVIMEMEKRQIGPYRYWAIKDKLVAQGGSFPTALSKVHGSKFLNEHERRSVGSAVAEWADGDLIAAHIGEGLDLICTEDMGGGHSNKSVFSVVHRSWLKTKYKCKFMTALELANSIQSERSC